MPYTPLISFVLGHEIIHVDGISKDCRARVLAEVPESLVLAAPQCTHGDILPNTIHNKQNIHNKKQEKERRKCKRTNSCQL